MKLAYSTIVNGNTMAYPGRVATVIHLSGGPLKCPYLAIGESQDPTFSEDTSFFVDLITKQTGEDGETNAVVFAGLEPLWQGNAVLELAKNLRQLSYFVKVETSGFYANDLRNLSTVANFISLDLKHSLSQSVKYGELIGSKVNFEVFQSNLLTSLTFLEHGKAFKEVKTTIIPGVNDSLEVVESIAQLIKNSCDQYALCQFVPWPLPLADEKFEKIKPPTRLHLLELAQVARKHAGRVVVRCHESDDQEVLPKA